MKQTIIEENIVNYDSDKQIPLIINKNFSNHFLFVRHIPKEHILVFKKLPTHLVKI